MPLRVKKLVMGRMVKGRFVPMSSNPQKTRVVQRMSGMEGKKYWFFEFHNGSAKYSTKAEAQKARREYLELHRKYGIKPNGPFSFRKTKKTLRKHGFGTKSSARQKYGMRSGSAGSHAARVLVEHYTGAKYKGTSKGTGNPVGYKAYPHETLLKLLEEPGQRVSAQQKRKVARELIRRGKYENIARFYLRGGNAKKNPAGAKFYKIWFSADRAGRDRTAAIVLDTTRYPHGKTTISTYSSLFPMSEASRMKFIHQSKDFDSFNEAFRNPKRKKR